MNGALASGTGAVCLPGSTVAALLAVHPLATLNAALNGLATVLLVAGWIAIARGQWRIHRQADDVEGRAVDLDLHASWLESVPGGGAATAGEPAFSLGGQALAFGQRKDDRFALSIVAPALAAWPALPIEVASGVAAEVVVESATLRAVAT